MEAVTQHVSLIDRDKHEALLNKVWRPSSPGAACRPRSRDSPLCAPQVYGTSFWVLSTDIVDALCSLTVCLVSRPYSWHDALMQSLTQGLAQVSACPTCLVDCLSVLVSHFTPPPVEMSSAYLSGRVVRRDGLTPPCADDSAGVEPLDQSAQRQLVIHEVHGALTKARVAGMGRCTLGGALTHLWCGKVVELVPAALPILQQVILQRMPHKHMSKEVHQQYLRNTFRVAELPQAGAIREGLLLGIISRLLEVRSRVPMCAALPSDSTTPRWTWKSSTKTWTTWTTSGKRTTG